MTPPEHEHGFILVSAMWLLILCGAIAAVLIVRARTGATAVSAAERDYRASLQRHDAVETVIADLLFNGARSRWAVVPTDGSVTVDGVDVPVRITSEAGRLDLNDGDLAVIDRALQGLAVPPSARARLSSQLASLHADKRRIASGAEVDALLAPLEVASGRCLRQEFTIAGGLQRPRDADLSSELAGALAIPEVGSVMPFSTGTALRLRAGRGMSLTEVIRLTGGVRSAFQVLGVLQTSSCSDH